MISDMYSLLEHLRSEELKAHNAAELCKTFGMDQVLKAREKFARELINRIENSPTELHRTLMDKPIGKLGDDD